MKLITNQGTTNLKDGIVIKVTNDEGDTLVELEVKKAHIYIVIHAPDKVATLTRV